MTNEEARLEIKTMRPQMDYNAAQFEAICLALDALEKQIPKKHEEYDLGNGRKVTADYSEKDITEVSRECFEHLIVPALRLYVAAQKEKIDPRKGVPPID